MYLALNDEQRLLAQTVRSFIEKELPASKVREMMATQDAFDERLWQKMAAQGWMSVTVPSEFGGMAESWLTVAVLFEAFGWGMVPGPFLATVGFAAPLLAAAGSAEQQSRWLSAIAEGKCRASVAYLEPESGYEFDSMRTTASERSELSTTPRTTSPTAMGASQSSRWTVAGKSPSLRMVAVGAVKPRARRSSRRRPWRRVWLAASCIDESSVV